MKTGWWPSLSSRPYHHDPWRDVRALRLGQASHDRLDFHGLTIALPDRVITLWAHSIAMGAQQSRGLGVPAREALVGLLLRHFPADRVAVFDDFGPPSGREGLARRIAGLERALAASPAMTRWLLVAAGAISAFLGLLAAVTRGLCEGTEAFLMSWLMVGVPLVALVLARHREYHAYWSGL